MPVPILQQSNLNFQGWWKFPAYIGVGQRTDYSDGGMTLRIGPNGERWVYKVGSRFNTTGSCNIYQVLMPDLGSWTLDINKAPIATLVQDFGLAAYLDNKGNDVRTLGGVCSDSPTAGPPCNTCLISGTGSSPRTHGLYWDPTTNPQDQRMHWWGDDYYHVQPYCNVNYGNAAGFALTPPNPQLHGPGWVCNNQNTGNMIFGGMPTPLSFPGSQGRTQWVFGWGGFWSVGDVASRGPAMFVINPLPRDTVQCYQCEPILFFYGLSALDETWRDQNYTVPDPKVDPLNMSWARRPPDANHGYFVGTDTVLSAAWLDNPNVRGIVFSCSIGQGFCQYPHGQGPTASSGWLGYTYIYNPDDIANAYLGKIPINQPRPSSFFPIQDNLGNNLIVTTPSSLVQNSFQGRTHGMFFEAASDGFTYLHVLDNYAYNPDGISNIPAVMVYKIQLATHGNP